MSLLARAIQTLFPDGPGGKPLYFVGTFNGVPFTKHWAVLDKADDKGYRFDFYLELDRKVIGQGGQPVHQHCALRIDPNLRPVAYLSAALGAQLSLDFAPSPDKVHVYMPDGSTPVVERDAAEFVVEANITGLDALFYAVAHERIRAGEAVKLFLLNKLLPIPYRATVQEPGVLRSSYDEEIRLRDDGFLLSCYLAKQGVKYEYQADAPPLPAWRGEVAAPPSLKHFPKYRPPADATFRVEDVSIGSSQGSIGGTLTIPTGAGPFPAILFLAGTGTHNRHGIAGEIDLGSHEIVDSLSQHGILGLRYDTRGAGTTKASNTLTSSLQPLFEDARACLAFLRARPEVDRSRICLVGHSQGGLVAMLLAADPADPPVRGLALLASMGRPLDEILDQQMLTIADRLKLTDAQKQQQMDEFHQLLDHVRRGDALEMDKVPDFLVPLARDTAWLKEHLDMPPARLMAGVTCPVWLAQGAKDFQVTERDASVLFEAAQRAGVPAEKTVFPGLDHLFKHIDGESTLETYHDLSRHVDVAFLAQLQGWLRGVMEVTA
ncbi:MAG: alpha/beta fold hydrolase [Deltaproteobacteria bacterium]|nr:alpha/beta fold hydrolase [Deltaproteobacteria bacterium]